VVATLSPSGAARDGEPVADRPSLSRQIAADLRAEILRGDLVPGAVLPSERQIVTRYGTTKATAGKAVGILVAEGLVSTEFGRGTFVRRRPPLRRVSAARRHAAHRDSGKPVFDVGAIDQGRAPSRRMLFVGRAPMPPAAARWLHAAPGDEAAVRRRVQLLDGEPVIVSTSYYPLWIAADTRLESPEALPEGPDELLESLGYRFARGIEVFSAHMPQPEEIELLDLPAGVPVVHLWDVDYDPDGRPLQAAHDVYAGDKHEFAYEWREGDIKP
jgi:GntR family transcriptional regulator